MRSVTRGILNHGQATEAIKFGARLIFLYVEGTEANLAVTSEDLAVRVRATMFAEHRDYILQVIEGQEQEWPIGNQHRNKPSGTPRNPGTPSWWQKPTALA